MKHIEEEKIGDVILNYKFYSGNDSYSDGTIEDTILEACRAGTEEELLKNSKEWAVLYHLTDIRENLLEWYPIQKNETVLEIGAGCGAISGVLCKKAGHVTGIELSKKRALINAYRNRSCKNLEIIVGNFEDIQNLGKYDYVTLIGVLEYSGLYIHDLMPYHEMLRKAKSYLKEGGKILIAIENKMGLKYLNGAKEDHTAALYGGINDYVNVKNVRTFSRPELEKIFDEVGIGDRIFYYPQPDYKLPITVYSDDLLPHVGDIRYYQTNYDMDRVYNFNEAIAFDQICKDGMMHYFSNSFFVVCGKNREDVLFAKYNRERKTEYRIKTVAGRDSTGRITVSKEPLCEAAERHIESMAANADKIDNIYPKVHILRGELLQKSYQYPFLEGYDLDEVFYEYRMDIDNFVSEVKKTVKEFYAYQASDKPFRMTEKFIKVFGPEAPKEAVSLEYTNIDYIFHNIRIASSGAYVIDYEWVFDFPIPHEYVIWRSLTQLFTKYRMYIGRQITLESFLEKLGISYENHQIYNKMDICFAEHAFGKDRNEEYTRRYLKNAYSGVSSRLY